MRTRKLLVKEADRVFSLYVRTRGSTYGYNHCFTCGIYLPIEQIQAGHFIARRYTNTRWHPLNVWQQCNRCNVELSGNLEIYEKKLVAQYGQLAVDALHDLARTNNGLSEDEIAQIIKKYK